MARRWRRSTQSKSWGKLGWACIVMDDAFWSISSCFATRRQRTEEGHSTLQLWVGTGLGHIFVRTWTVMQVSVRPHSCIDTGADFTTFWKKPQGWFAVSAGGKTVCQWYESKTFIPFTEESRGSYPTDGHIQSGSASASTDSNLRFTFDTWFCISIGMECMLQKCMQCHETCQGFLKWVAFYFGHLTDQRSVSAAAGDGPTKGQRTKALN